MSVVALVCQHPHGWVDHLRGTAAGRGLSTVAITSSTASASTPAVHIEDTTSGADIWAALQKLQADGHDVVGCTTCDDTAVAATAEAAAAFGLPHADLAGVTTARDKFLSRVANPFGDHPPKIVCDRHGLVEAIETIGSPVIIKPRFGRASDHVRKLAGPDDIDASFLDRRPEWVVETFIPGVEYSADVVVHNGEVVAAGVLEKFLVSRHRFQEEGFKTTAVESFPSVEDFLNGVVVRTGLNNCLAHIEFKLTPDPALIEANPGRMGGLLVAPLVFERTGIDLAEEQMSMALGLPPHRRERRIDPRARAALVTFLSQEGTIREVKDPSQLRARLPLSAVFPMCRVGQHVSSVEAECAAYGAFVVDQDDPVMLSGLHAELHAFTATGIIQDRHGDPHPASPAQPASDRADHDQTDHDQTDHDQTFRELNEASVR